MEGADLTKEEQSIVDASIGSNIIFIEKPHSGRVFIWGDLNWDEAKDTIEDQMLDSGYSWEDFGNDAEEQVTEYLQHDLSSLDVYIKELEEDDNDFAIRVIKEANL